MAGGATSVSQLGQRDAAMVSITGLHGLQQGDPVVGGEAADGVGQRAVGDGELAALGAAGELPDALDDLREAGGGQRVAARLEAAGGIDRQATVERGLAVEGGAPGLAAGNSPMSSSEISSNGAKASWISAKSTRSGPKPAMANASRAAAWVARKRGQLATMADGQRIRPLPDAGHAHAACGRWSARPRPRRRRSDSSAAAAADRRPCGSPSPLRCVTICWKWASGFCAPCAWFFTATWAISRATVAVSGRTAPA